MAVILGFPLISTDGLFEIVDSTCAWFNARIYYFLSSVLTIVWSFVIILSSFSSSLTCMDWFDLLFVCARRSTPLTNRHVPVQRWCLWIFMNPCKPCSRDQLLGLRRVWCRLPESAVKAIGLFGLRRHRGARAGRNRQRPIPVLCSAKRPRSRDHSYAQ